VSPLPPSFPPQPRVYSQSDSREGLILPALSIEGSGYREPKALNRALLTAHYPPPTFFTPCFHTLTNSLSFPKRPTPLQSSKSELFAQNTGGGGSPPPPCLPARKACLCGKPHVFSNLPPLCPPFAPFSAPAPFIFNNLQLLFPKHPAWGCRRSQRYPLLTAHLPACVRLWCRGQTPATVCGRYI
jgi:hypothetical protein